MKLSELLNVLSYFIPGSNARILAVDITDDSVVIDYILSTGGNICVLKYSNRQVKSSPHTKSAEVDHKAI